MYTNLETLQPLCKQLLYIEEILIPDIWVSVIFEKWAISLQYKPWPEQLTKCPEEQTESIINHANHDLNNGPINLEIKKPWPTNKLVHNTDPAVNN